MFWYRGFDSQRNRGIIGPKVRPHFEAECRPFECFAEKGFSNRFVFAVGVIPDPVLGRPQSLKVSNGMKRGENLDRTTPAGRPNEK